MFRRLFLAARPLFRGLGLGRRDYTRDVVRVLVVGSYLRAKRARGEAREEDRAGDEGIARGEVS
jgi:hypothetical protein